MNLLEELRQLNTEDPGSWPAAIKAGALVVLLISIIIAGYFLDWQAQWETLDKTQVEEETLKQSYLLKKSSAVNLDALRQQQKEIEQ